MSTPGPSDPAALLRSTQLIVGVLACGVVVFAGIAAVVSPVGDPPPPVALGLDGTALAAVVVTLSTLAASFTVPARIVEGARSAEPPQRLQAFRTGRVVGAALCEGPALLWCVALLLSGNRWYLAPVTLLVALMLLHLPTREGFEAATGPID